MDKAQPRHSAPWHLWAIGLASLLWNGFGGYDYIMSQTRNAEYMAAMTEPFGYSAEQALAYFDSFPLWADAAWAVGVWGSVLGSVLLLLRSRYAFHAFAASLLGLVGGMVYQLQHPLPGLSDSAMSIGFTLGILVVILLLIAYSRRMAGKGVLR